MVGTRRGPGGDPVLGQSIVLTGDDEADGTSVSEIIGGIRALLGPRRVTAWNEATRNQAEAAAWAHGRRRICDLPAEDHHHEHRVHDDDLHGVDQLLEAVGGGR